MGRLRKILRTRHPFDALANLYVVSIDSETADQQKADRVLDLNVGTVLPVAERRSAAARLLNGAAPIGILRKTLTEMLEEDSAEILIPRDGGEPRLTLQGFQRALAGAIRAQFPSAAAAEQAFGITSKRISYTLRSRSRDYVPHQHLWRAPADLLTILHGLHAETVREQMGSRWRAAYHLWHSDRVLEESTGAEFLRKLIGAAPNARTRLRESLEILLPGSQARQLTNVRYTPFTYRGFEQQVIDTLYAYLHSYYATGAALGIAASRAHRSNRHFANPLQKQELPDLLSLQDFADAYAVRGLRRYRTRAAAAKALSVNMYLLEERAVRGRQVLERVNFSRFVREWLPDEVALVRTELSHVDARDRYIAAVCRRVGDQGLAAEALECSTNGLSQMYQRAKGNHRGRGG